MLLYENLIPQNREAFTAKVKEISTKLGINPNWLMLMMKHESGLISSKPNSIGAVGLIQFLPKTAEKLGTSTAELASMTNVKQLDYVYQFFKSFAGQIKSYGDLHLVAFFPIALGKPDNFVFQTDTLAASTVAKQNFPFDLNKDGKITKGEAVQYFQNFAESAVPKEFKEQFQKYSNTMDKITNWMIVAAIVILAVAYGIKAVKS